MENKFISGQNILILGHLNKNDKKTFIFIEFILCGKTDIKYEISVSELTHPPNFSLIRLKLKSWSKVGTLTPKTKNDVITGDQM